jgi:hypothetical protein
VRETTLKFKRVTFTAIFTFFAVLFAHPVAVHYPAHSIAALICGASAFIGMLLANFVFRE